MATVKSLDLHIQPIHISAGRFRNALPDRVNVEVIFGSETSETVTLLLGEKQQTELLRLLMEWHHGDRPQLRAFVDKKLHSWRKRWDALREERDRD